MRKKSNLIWIEWTKVMSQLPYIKGECMIKHVWSRGGKQKVDEIKATHDQRFEQ